MKRLKAGYHCEFTGMVRQWKKNHLGLIFSVCILLAACVQAPVSRVSRPPEEIALKPPPVLRKDVIHRVAPGETIWRIAKMYDVRPKEIVLANKLEGPNELQMGQSLFIPQAGYLRPVISLYPSKKWKYIIIHHSATDEGNALCFHRSHYGRGFYRGLGYHFVIDNGTKFKPDGHIEVSPRWLKQQDGAHCKASGMNSKAIGICLVGNFSRDSLTEKQMKSLIYLINRLRAYYKIPLENVMGHGQVPGARTECPGRYFPWKKLKKSLLAD